MTCWCGGSLEETQAHPDYQRCVQCGTLVANECPDPTALLAFYGFQSYWHKHVSQHYQQPTIEQRADQDIHGRVLYWWNDIAPKTSLRGSLLEIGCCHGGFLNAARANGFKRVVGIEPDAETCTYAQQRFGLPEVYSGLWPDTQVTGPFDVICGFDVLEHFANPLEAVSSVRANLAPGGMYMFQTPCYRGEQNWDQFKPGEHLFLFDASSIQYLMRKAGLTCQIKEAVFSCDMVVWGSPA